VSFSRPTKELAPKPKLLAEQNAEVERKNAMGRTSAPSSSRISRQLALTVEGQSEFLANNSPTACERRNSILIFSQQLTENHPVLFDKLSSFWAATSFIRSDRLHLINNRHPRSVDD